MIFISRDKGRSNFLGDVFAFSWPQRKQRIHRIRHQLTNHHSLRTCESNLLIPLASSLKHKISNFREDGDVNVADCGRISATPQHRPNPPENSNPFYEGQRVIICCMLQLLTIIILWYPMSTFARVWLEYSSSCLEYVVQFCPTHATT